MAITKNAKKAIRSHAAKRVFNVRRKTALHGAMKAVHTDIKEKKTDSLKDSVAKAYKAIDKAAKRGIIKKNTANRKKSRLMKKVAGI